MSRSAVCAAGRGKFIGWWAARFQLADRTMAVCAAWRTHDLLGVLAATPLHTWELFCYLFGFLWGFGGLTFRAHHAVPGIVAGHGRGPGASTAAFGTLVPPIFSGELFSTLIWSMHGQIDPPGAWFLPDAGITVIGYAGHAKKDDMPPEAQRAAIAEFDLRRGILVAIFSGVMSSCFAYGLDAGEPVRRLTLAAGTDVLAQGLPVLCIVLLGGTTTNFLWCFYLIARNKSARELIGGIGPSADRDIGPPPLLRNYLLSALAGTIWYFQFFFYTMGESQMGRFGFSSWTIHMASIIIFSSLWGFALKEWKGASRRTLAFVFLGLFLLISSTVVIGVGNALPG